MSTESNKTLARQLLERAFNQGDLTVIDSFLAEDGIDHQEPPGTDFRSHLKEVVTALRTAFPDLHFEIHDMVAEGDTVAFRSTMTGTHTGVFNMGPIRNFPPSGRKVTVPHMHFIRIVDGKNTDLWHVWDIPAMTRQLGIMPQPQSAPR